MGTGAASELGGPRPPGRQRAGGFRETVVKPAIAAREQPLQLGSGSLLQPERGRKRRASSPEAACALCVPCPVSRLAPAEQLEGHLTRVVVVAHKVERAPDDEPAPFGTRRDETTVRLPRLWQPWIFGKRVRGQQGKQAM